MNRDSAWDWEAEHRLKIQQALQVATAIAFDRMCAIQIAVLEASLTEEIGRIESWGSDALWRHHEFQAREG